MNRHYYISDDLDDLEQIERELEDRGVSTPQIHVLSEDTAGVQKHHLHEVPDFMKKDVVRSTSVAAIFGAIAAVVVLLVAHFLGWAESWGWTPFVFLAVVVLGFITWEGGMWGIQEPNAHFRRFQGALKEGKHILYVEVKKGEQEDVLKAVVNRHPRLRAAGVEPTRTDLLIGVEKGWRRFIKWAP